MWSLYYGFVTAFAGLVGVKLCAFLADYTGRKPLFAAAYLLAALPLFWLAAGATPTTLGFIVFVSITVCCNNIPAIGLDTYTTENYPTHLRALGTGVAGAWIRPASMLGPLLVGFILPIGGLNAVFGLFGIVAVVAALVFSIETRAKLLEELSPPIRSVLPEVFGLFATFLHYVCDEDPVSIAEVGEKRKRSSTWRIMPARSGFWSFRRRLVRSPRPYSARPKVDALTSCDDH